MLVIGESAAEAEQGRLAADVQRALREARVADSAAERKEGGDEHDVA